MARPLKQGIEYFSFDVDFFSDVKIRKIARACGPASTSILICLLCNIYRDKGYYISWDEDLPFVVADSIGAVGITEGAVEEVIKKALQVGFFNQELYEKYKILTSNGIQSRFKSAVVRREEIEYITEYLVTDIKNEVIAYNNSINDNGSTQSKVKVKRKKSNIPPTPPKGGGDKPKRVSKKGKPAILNSSARSVFEDYYLNTFGSSYYWTAKDAGSMADLLKKIAYSRTQKEMSVDDDSMLYALKMLLSSVKEGWIFENFSVTNINSKYNEIVAKAKNGNHSSGNKDGTGKPAGIKSHTF